MTTTDPELTQAAAEIQNTTDWRRYPKLRLMFEHRTPRNLHWHELVMLIDECVVRETSKLSQKHDLNQAHLKIRELTRELADAHAQIATLQDKDAPIPILLRCPFCNHRHIDVGEYATKPHHTHSCQRCGESWRPAVVKTVGVQFLPGFKNVNSIEDLMLEAAWYIRSAAVTEPEEGLVAEATGHALADRMFDALGIDRTGPEHKHEKEPMKDPTPRHEKESTP